MTRRLFIGLGMLAPTLVCIGMLAGSCGGSSSDDDPSPTDSGLGEGAAEVDAFFQVEQPVSTSLAAGGDVELPGGGKITLPLESPDGVEIAVAEASLTAEADESFQQWNPEVELQDNVSQVTVTAEGEAPEYLITRLPSPDDNSRIYVAGYLDDDTEQLSWIPAPTYYDPDTQEAIAAIGLGNFLSSEPDAQTRKLAAPAWNITTSYRGYIAVAVGRAPYRAEFRSEIVFFAVDPREAVEVEFEGEPVQISALIGASLTAVREEPLDPLTLQSPFGPRGAIRGAPRASRQHKGADYVASTGTQVLAAGDGVVSGVQWQDENDPDAGAGYYMTIDHGNGEDTRYFHLTADANAPTGCALSTVTCCSDIGVCEGQPVVAGQVIASSDDTGHTSGPHLHFEVRKNRVPVDPELIFDERVETTIAMAIDFNIQDATKEKMNLTFGTIEREDLEAYASEVSVAGLQPGEYTLQHVAIEPSGTFEILGEIPLTITGPFAGVTGSEIYYRDTTTTRARVGETEFHKEITETTFSLVAVGENRLEGQGHVSYVLAEGGTGAAGNCPSWSGIASVEWDVFYEGNFNVLPDGSIDVGFFGTPDHSPDYVYTQTSVGPCDDFTTTYSTSTPAITGIILVDGEYYFREDEELDENQTGQWYYEVVVDSTN